MIFVCPSNVILHHLDADKFFFELVILLNLAISAMAGFFIKEFMISCFDNEEMETFLRNKLVSLSASNVFFLCGYQKNTVGIELNF